MEKAFAKAGELADIVKEYVNTRIESIKLTAAEKSSLTISIVLAGMVVAVIFLLFIIFISTALALGLGEWTGSTWAGFLIVGGLHFIMGILVWTGKEKIIQLPVMNALIRQLFKKDDEEV